jgi:hypothetical protein
MPPGIEYMLVRLIGGCARAHGRDVAAFSLTGCIQTLSGTARDALFAHAMTGSAVASLAIIAAPHLEMLLRRVFHGRG